MYGPDQKQEIDLTQSAQFVFVSEVTATCLFAASWENSICIYKETEEAMQEVAVVSDYTPNGKGGYVFTGGDDQYVILAPGTYRITGWTRGAKPGSTKPWRQLPMRVSQNKVGFDDGGGFGGTGEDLDYNDAMITFS